jgi:hypothetical protein
MLTLMFRSFRCAAEEDFPIRKGIFRNVVGLGRPSTASIWPSAGRDLGLSASPAAGNRRSGERSCTFFADRRNRALRRRGFGETLKKDPSGIRGHPYHFQDPTEA